MTAGRKRNGGYNCLKVYMTLWILKSFIYSGISRKKEVFCMYLLGKTSFFIMLTVTFIHIKSAVFFLEKLGHAEAAPDLLIKAFHTARMTEDAKSFDSGITQHALFQLLSGHHCFPLAISASSLIAAAREAPALLTRAQTGAVLNLY